MPAVQSGRPLDDAACMSFVPGTTEKILVFPCRGRRKNSLDPRDSKNAVKAGLSPERHTYLAARDESGELAEGLLAGAADPQEQGVPPRELKDPANPRHVVHGLVEQHEVHHGVRLVVLLGQGFTRKREGRGVLLISSAR